MTWMKFYQPQDMDTGLPVVSAPLTAQARGPIWYYVTNGVNTSQLHSPGSGSFVYDGTSLTGGTMDALWVWNGPTQTDANLLYAVATSVDPVTYIGLAQAGDALGAQEYLLAGTATYSGNDTIDASATSGGNTINGYDGSDVIVGGAGDDKITGGPGKDVIDGGPGNDTARYADARDQYYLVSWGAQTAVIPKDWYSQPDHTNGVDTLVNVENVSFSNGTYSLASSVNEYFRPLEYIASSNDLSNRFGTTANPADVFQQYAHDWGYQQGFRTTFHGLDYIASYPDLMNYYGAGATPDVGATHFIQAGRFEGRSTTFDGMKYIASYPDLISAFGANEDAGASHYIQAGRFEGRTATFDGLSYIASYGDLIAAFGANAHAGASHYVAAGHAEGRSVTFDGLEYIASYSDLISAFGTNASAGTNHFINNGYGEARHVSFDGLEYIASYPDLIQAFHNQVAASAHPEDIGATHYIIAGHGESRATDLFDASQYLQNYADLQAAFGTNTEAATVHYITQGYFEHRTDHA